MLEVDEGLAGARDVPQRRDRQGLVGSRGRLARMARRAAFGRRLGAGRMAFAQRRRQPEGAVGRAGASQPGWAAGGDEGGDIVAPLRPATEAARQPDIRVEAARDGEASGPDPQPSVGRPDRDAADATAAALDGGNDAGNHRHAP